MINLTQQQCANAARSLRQQLGIARELRLYGIPRGGIPAAYLIAKEIGPTCTVVDKVEDATVIVDDIIDSGATMAKYEGSNARKVALFGKVGKDYPGVLVGERTDDWLVFPWEGNAVGSASDIVTRTLQYIGENPNRPGLLETPARVVKAWGEWFGGYKMNEKEIFKVFEDGAENVDEMVVLTNIPVHSMCEHHMAPFYGVAHVGYIPNGKIVGLSKIVRLVRMYSRRLQVQERLTNQIADAMQNNLDPKGVAVVIRAQHSCMSTRGACVTGVDTITSAMRGALHDEVAARAEFFSLIKGV